MRTTSLHCVNRRTFTALAATLPTVRSRASEVLDQQACFAADIARCYESQQVAFDLDDVDAVFRGMRSPRLGVATASGANRVEDAAGAVLRHVGAHGTHALAVVAFAPGEARLAAYRIALGAWRSALDPAVTLVYGGCCDESLGSGIVRLSLLLG